MAVSIYTKISNFIEFKKKIVNNMWFVEDDVWTSKKQQLKITEFIRIEIKIKNKDAIFLLKH